MLAKVVQIGSKRHQQMMMNGVSQLHHFHASSVLATAPYINNLEDAQITDSGPSLSFKSICKSRSSLQDFALTYFMHHKLDSINFLKYMDIFTYFQGIFYLADDKNEREIHNNNNDNNINDIDEDEFRNTMNTNKEFGNMVSFLKKNEFYDENMDKEVKDGLMYWKLERYLCDDNNWNKDNKITEELIKKCVSVKSFYTRINNLMLYNLLNKKWSTNDDLHFLKIHETLYEIYDDLEDYNHDIMNKTFNVYRMYTKLYGKHGEEIIKQRFKQFIQNIQNQYQTAKVNIDQDIVEKHEEIWNLKYNEMMHSLPEPIIDEDQFRLKNNLC